MSVKTAGHSGNQKLQKAALSSKHSNFPGRLQIIFAPWIQTVFEFQLSSTYPQQTPEKLAFSLNYILTLFRGFKTSELILTKAPLQFR